MESTGRPGQVHISEETRSFLGDAYILEDGDEVFGKSLFLFQKKPKLTFSTQAIKPSSFSVERPIKFHVMLVKST